MPGVQIPDRPDADTALVSQVKGSGHSLAALQAGTQACGAGSHTQS